MERIKRQSKKSKAKELTFRQAYESFITDSAAEGKADKTLKTYRTHLKSIEKHLDVDLPLAEIEKADLSAMIVSMRKAGLSANSISSYARVTNTFLKWCEDQDYCYLPPIKYKPEETVKETYSDDELTKLLRRPSETCRFSIYRTWVIQNFLLNCGCRAGTIRGILIKDVDLDAAQVVTRHNKTGRVQVLPLCRPLVQILREYIDVRKGDPGDYLFPDEFGGKLSENALRLSIARYNKSRGVEKTSIHLYRHTFARMYLMSGGGNAFTLQKLLGHTTLKTTKIYCNVFDSDVAKNFDDKSPLMQLQSKNKGKRIKR